MKKLLISTALAALMSMPVAAMSTGAFAAKLGVSIVDFDNNFQTLLMHGMQARAKEKGADIQVEDAHNDVAKQAMQAGDFSLTAFDNAKGQGGGGVDAALALAKGEKVDRVVYVPFELVTPANAAEYLNKN